MIMVKLYKSVYEGKTLDAKVLNMDEMAAAIMKECKLKAKGAAFKYGAGKVSDLEGFLITEIWSELVDKEESFHTMLMIRRLIGLRTIDYIREQMRYNKETSFTMMQSSQMFNSEEGDTYEPKIAGLVDESDFELGTAISHFRATLTDKQRQILDLHTAGYGNNEIVEMVGCSINTPKNVMKKIKDLAVSFGL